MSSSPRCARSERLILRPLTNAPSSFARLGARFDNAALLRAAGVPVMLRSFETQRVLFERYRELDAETPPAYR
ncbi:MAG TPA: hypothetical protein VLA33_12125 [Gemmatimonadota bacterium]|nr:hypothetical protein [Gemmatimonadota bacterium]